MADTIFSIANGYALLGWILLVFFPNADFTQNVVRYGVILILALAYAILIPMGMTEAPEGGFSSIDGVRALFTSDLALVAGWIHYLAFDLFVGAWVSEQSRQIGLPGYLRITCLLFTFMLGPFGFLLFHIFRFFKVRMA